MPISDTEGYPPGHFKRVYEYIIKPACEKSGFEAVRADDVKKTNVIVLDIIQRIINSEMAICDLSGRNPNVLYELGIRQSFDLPVSLIKDEITTRVFDIQGFRDVEYNSSLRIDEVNAAIEKLATNIIETYESKGEDVNSIVELLGITKAKISNQKEVSGDTALILKSLSDISLRLSNLEKPPTSSDSSDSFNPIWEKLEMALYFKKDGIMYGLNDKIKHARHSVGKITHIGYNKQSEAIFDVVFDSGDSKTMVSKLAKFSKVQS